MWHILSQKGCDSKSRVSSRIFCLGRKIVCKDQLCVKHAKFLTPFLSINHQCTKKHKARVRYCIIIVKTFFLGGGENWREVSLRTPQ